MLPNQFPMQPTERFSSRVENYVKYRPHYPQEVVTILKNECGLTPKWRVADIGSGTGISTELFLNNGNTVFAVEPNREMRQAAEKLLGGHPNFISIDGTAEDTTLPDDCVEMAAAGQAFHWFDHDKATQEFPRILKPGGWVVLMWNERRKDSPFLDDYERLLNDYSTDSDRVNRRNGNAEDLSEMFSPSQFRLRTCSGIPKPEDFEGLRGGLLSSSYAPLPGHRNYEPMIEELARLFEKHQQDGMVVFEYETQVYFGQIG